MTHANRDITCWIYLQCRYFPLLYSFKLDQNIDCFCWVGYMHANQAADEAPIIVISYGSIVLPQFLVTMHFSTCYAWIVLWLHVFWQQQSFQLNNVGQWFCVFKISMPSWCPPAADMVRPMSVFYQFRSPLVIYSITHECGVRGFSFHVHNMNRCYIP